MNLPCDNHPGQLAQLLMTNLETGETLTLCGPCVLTWAEMVAGVSESAEMTEPEPEPAAEEVADLEAAEPAPDASPKSEPEAEAAPEPKAKRRGAPAPPAQTPGQ